MRPETPRKPFFPKRFPPNRGSTCRDLLSCLKEGLRRHDGGNGTSHGTLLILSYVFGVDSTESLRGVDAWPSRTREPARN